jgi:hypothetical protein
MAEYSHIVIKQIIVENISLNTVKALLVKRGNAAESDFQSINQSINQSLMI